MTEVVILSGTKAKKGNGSLEKRIEIPDGRDGIKVALPSEWHRFVKDCLKEGVRWRNPDDAKELNV